ncbi:PREDICTED: ribonuclease-like [Gekko japonicus]|uniref:Ribonuclease-like n=1 Tax=Gekko japonicus TaxID=146911 RepID=A0ABM1KED4_GEKJA|nr:PREDICTED: ribonuclease-like [Gekko japonicus]XP_015272072.1 PREDICTED: ribonuclease-like [Gekko japonicus]
MLLILLILLGPLPASPQTYQNFQRKHMDYPKTSPHLAARLYCNQMMQRRNMTNPICKEFNSFIHEPANVVDAICTNGGTHVGRNLYDSHAAFHLTNCEVIGGRGQRPPCNYRGRTECRRIEVACNSRSLPVHFHKMI